MTARPADNPSPAPSENPYAGLLANGLARLGKSVTAERVRLRDFFLPAWGAINPGIRFIPNWHIDLIAEHLEAVHLGQIKLLDIEMPPRMSKSFLVTTAFPCWEWSEDPTERYLFSSYNQKLCNRHSLDRRKILRSAWYQNRWGQFVELADDQNLKTEFQNKAGGHMITAPFGSSGTGSGGRRLIIDDPLNPKQANSKVQRESAVEYYRGTLTSRLDDEAHSAIVMVAQRTDVEDLQGKVVSEKDGWTILRIPMQAKERKVYTYPISGQQKIYERGELLCPARKSQRGVDALRKAMGRSAAAQLDQEPAEDKGLLFQRQHWKPLTVCPVPLFVLNTWDTAVSEKDEAAYNAGLCIVRHAGGYHFCKGIVHEHLAYPALKRAIRNKFELDRADAILIEHKSSGQQANQELGLPDPGTGEPALPVLDMREDEAWKAWMKLDKYQRASAVAPLWQAGLISYDPAMEGAAEMIEEFAYFPRGTLKDRVDAGVHGVRYLSQLDQGPAPEEDYEEEDAPDAYSAPADDL